MSNFWERTYIKKSVHLLCLTSISGEIRMSLFRGFISSIHRRTRSYTFFCFSGEVSSSPFPPLEAGLGPGAAGLASLALISRSSASLCVFVKNRVKIWFKIKKENSVSVQHVRSSETLWKTDKMAATELAWRCLVRQQKYSEVILIN